jgi:hypothetical protein
MESWAAIAVVLQALVVAVVKRRRHPAVRTQGSNTGHG